MTDQTAAQRPGIAPEPEKVEAHACLAFLHSFFPELELPEDLSKEIIRIREGTVRAIIDLAGGQGAQYNANLSIVATDEDGNACSARVDDDRMTIGMITLHLSAIEAICYFANTATQGREESEIRLAAAGGYKKIAVLMESHVDALLEIASQMDDAEAKKILLGECKKARVVVSGLAFSILGMSGGMGSKYANFFRFLFEPIPMEETLEVGQAMSFMGVEAGRAFGTEAIKLHNSRVKIARIIGVMMVVTTFAPLVFLAQPLINMLAEELRVWNRFMIALLKPAIVLGLLTQFDRIFGAWSKIWVEGAGTKDPEVTILRFRGLIRKYKLLFDGDEQLNAKLTKECRVDFRRQSGDIANLEDMIREMDYSRGYIVKLMELLQTVSNANRSLRNTAAGTSRGTDASEVVDEDAEITSTAPQVLS